MFNYNIHEICAIPSAGTSKRIKIDESRVKDTMLPVGTQNNQCTNRFSWTHWHRELIPDWPVGAAGLGGLLSHWDKVHLIFLFGIARNLDVASFRAMRNTIVSDSNYCSARQNFSIAVLCCSSPRGKKKDEEVSSMNSFLPGAVLSENLPRPGLRKSDRQKLGWSLAAVVENSSSVYRAFV